MLTVDSWQLAVGSWQLIVDSWQLTEGISNCDIMFFGAVESCGTYFAWLLSVLRVSINGLCFEL
ncbi:hypothetical protein QUB13_30015 [Microcoleus sp. B4-D4]